MGSKHAKKRFLIVNYSMNVKGGYDELVELSKKKCGPVKILLPRTSNQENLIQVL